MSWRWLDYVVISFFFLLTVGIGKFFAGRNHSTDSYFMGNRSLPGWAVGFSMLSTLMSSITFLAYPATTIMTDWRLYPKDFMVPVAQCLAVLFIAPRFRAKPGRVSAYEVLEERFNIGLRLYGAGTYVMAQVLKLGTVLYLVSIPVGAILNLQSNWVIVLSGAFVAVYSCAGGISAVVYTDVVQGIVLLLGGLSVVVVAAVALPGGLMGVFKHGTEEGKFFMGDNWSVDWQTRTIPTVLVYGFTSFMGHTMSYQHTVQRYLLVPNERELRRAIGMSALLSVPTWGMFYLVGTCVWAYYEEHPDANVSSMLQEARADEVFPYFILNVLPPVVSGIVISGVFAAAMSTMDSSLNAVSSVIVTDVIKRLLWRGLKDTRYLLIARVASVCIACCMVLMALVLAGLQKESMNDLYNGMQSIMGGPVIGLFATALFLPAVGSLTATAAVLVSTAVNFYLVSAHYGWCPADPWSQVLHAYWVSFWVNVVFMAVVAAVEAVGWVTGWRRAKNMRRFRIFSPKQCGAALDHDDELDVGAVGVDDVEIEMAPLTKHVGREVVES